MTSATCATIDVDRVLGEGADGGAGRRLRDSLVTQPGGKRGSLVKQRAFRRATSGDSDATAMLTATSEAQSRSRPGVDAGAGGRDRGEGSGAGGWC